MASNKLRARNKRGNAQAKARNAAGGIRKLYLRIRGDQRAKGGVSPNIEPILNAQRAAFEAIANNIVRRSGNPRSEITVPRRKFKSVKGFEKAYNKDSGKGMKALMQRAGMSSRKMSKALGKAYDVTFGADPYSK